MNGSVALEGKRYPQLRFAVEADRVRAFADAVGHPLGGVPPTFVTAPELAAGLSNLLDDPELGIELSDVLHGEQAYEWRRPIDVGEVLTVEATIERIRGRGATRFLTLHTELRDDADLVVALGRCTLIVRSDA
jgi:N-terminal half of MaoC dehydratase